MHDRAMTPPPFPRALLATGLAALVLAGCGGDDDSDDAPDDSATAAAAAPTADDLEGKAFVATEVAGGTIVDGSEIIVTFEDGAVIVAAGCNTQRGGYEIADGTMTVDPLVATMMACDDALMAQDQLMADLLSAGPTVALDGDELTISSPTTTVTLTAQ
jgi:heat shock protein HslJ